MDVNEYNKKLNICICAMEETEPYIDYHEYNNDKYFFLKEFSKNTRKCS